MGLRFVKKKCPKTHEQKKRDVGTDGLRLNQARLKLYGFFVLKTLISLEKEKLEIL